MAIRSLKTGLFTRSGMAGNSVIMPGSYESIATVDVGAGGVSSVTFSGIPSTYKHLQIRLIAQSNQSSTSGVMQFNGDTASNYSNHYLSGDGSSAAAGSLLSSFMYSNYIPSSSNTNVFGAGVIDILDYSDTNKYTTFRSLSGGDLNGSGIAALYSGSWRNTAAITSITLTRGVGLLSQYSSFALYGVN